MYIKQLIIKNFRNLKEVNLNNLTNFVILVGENGSGKTNIFEAIDLFFNQFEFAHEQNRGNLIDWYLWFDTNTDEPIEFEVTLGGLSNAQVKKLAEIADVKQQKGDLTINRSIVQTGNTLIYRNDSITWGAVAIRRSEQGYSVEGGSKFDPNSFAQMITQDILKKAFTYVPLSRGAELRTAHGSILVPEIRQELINKGQDTAPRGMREWNKTRQIYKDKGWTSEQFECKGSQLLITRGTTPIPYELEGAGYQALFNLLKLTERSNQLIAIEEPENHLHPRLQKTFIREVKELVGTEKQIFLSTHSPFILDLVNLSSIWLVYKDGLESKVQYASSSEGINTVLEKLGVKPSYLLLANGILIVEGLTDKDVYADWARKIGKPFETASIITINAEGAGNIKKYLVSEAVQKTCVKTYALCDQNSESMIKKAVKGIVPDGNILCLQRGDIEDYYPRELVLEFAKEWGKLKGKKEDEIPIKIEEGETVKIINEFLGKDWWKKPLAERVTEKMKPEQIDGEVQSKLSEIYDAVYEGS